MCVSSLNKKVYQKYHLNHQIYKKENKKENIKPVMNKSPFDISLVESELNVKSDVVVFICFFIWSARAINASYVSRPESKIWSAGSSNP